MILDHEWLAALAGLADHSTGNLSLTGLIIWILIREGLPLYRRARNRNSTPTSNPGNSGLVERMSACEADIKEVKDFCSRADERWISQKDFNERMEGHVKNFYKKFDQLAGLGK